jgi:putative phosphoesterase
LLGERVRVAAIADIHGNLPALQAVLAEVREEEPDLLVVCGDVASGPMPAQTIDALRKLPRVRFVRGNADTGLIDAFDEEPRSDLPGPFVDWCAKQIDKGQRDFLASFERFVVVEDVDGIGKVLFCHATPTSEELIFTAETPDRRLRELLAGVDAQLVVCGHTHMQFDRTVDHRRVVNAGSVGMPAGQPGAYWTMLGPGVELRRTDYDREDAAAQIRSLDWPVAAEFARDNVINVPSVEVWMDFLRKGEARQSAT